MQEVFPQTAKEELASWEVELGGDHGANLMPRQLRPDRTLMPSTQRQAKDQFSQMRAACSAALC